MLALAACATADDADELARTWRGARVVIPAKYLGRDGYYLLKRLDGERYETLLRRLPAKVKIPTVVYIHGCSGHKSSSRTYFDVFGMAGYAVLAPDSFARNYRPKTCDTRAKRSLPGAPRDLVYAMRVAEIRYAARALRALPWVDRDNLFLVGHSQGGTSVAMYAGNAFKARVISGARCTKGLNAPRAEPVLAVGSEDDPWFRGHYHRRNCGTRRPRHPNLTNIMVLGDEHVVGRVDAGRDAILEFLARHTTRRTGRGGDGGN